MSRIVCESIRLRCEKCKTLIEFEVDDYYLNDIGHGRPDGLSCPVCNYHFKSSSIDLPHAWVIEIKKRLAEFDY